MSDIKLFHLKDGGVRELEGTIIAMEKSLQNKIEMHLDALLGVSFLASEHSTGKVHGGRIDTLGIDENNCPVIIEYKRATNENVINQGLFYLDWLMDHREAFVLLVRDKLGKERSDKIDWSNPRLMCIAGDFTKYDEHAVQQINRNIELIRYKNFDDLLLFELVNAVSFQGDDRKVSGETTVSEALEKSSPKLKDLWQALRDFLENLGEDVQMKTLKFYFAFKKIKNFACVEVYNRADKLAVYIKVDPDTVRLEKDFTKDVRDVGHWGTGYLQITLRSMDDLERAKPLLEKSYEIN